MSTGDEAKQALLSMGFSEQQVLQALAVTNNVDEAVNYIVSNLEEPPVQQVTQTTTTQPTLMDNFTSTITSLLSNFKVQEYKMILVVREDLKMGKGKIGAQCGHAVLGAYRQIIRGSNKLHQEWLNNWEYIGEAKICVKCNSEKEMIDISNVAKEKGLNTHIVVDAGRTQIASGSKTVLAIGPAPVEVINEVTSQLRLL
jgi:PTH2 family peptidyl-tRNA hydrolase